ncbi:hypothetical protein EVAR_41332_1 [Eumeta japonica]|uniref:Uncharacterized protein n=1 Tax=Eumeta variegata TaxID=151549 RepID=A0A4C1X113_EUMVA|nr:hypothetical protein EVAR_41332_1 [Eumeta japonica]
MEAKSKPESTSGSELEAKDHNYTKPAEWNLRTQVRWSAPPMDTCNPREVTGASPASGTSRISDERESRLVDGSKELSLTGHLYSLRVLSVELDLSCLS